MASDEPLYCRGCGEEYCDCGHTWEAPGHYCELCGGRDCNHPECVGLGGGSDTAEECERWAREAELGSREASRG